VSARATGDRVLVAGIGNVFLEDDGFGVEVVSRIDRTRLPDCVDVGDYGIRGVHLAYELLEGRHGTLILVDALPTGEPPGTIAVLEVSSVQPETQPAVADAFHAPLVDGHSMAPQAVLGLLRTLGGRVDRVLVVGCQPAETQEQMGLSEQVAAAVDDAVKVVSDLARREAASLAERAAAVEAR
jgi:hydrogenase maturation protease